MACDNLLIFADSERNANMLYAVGVFVSDPFIYLRLEGKETVIISDLEIDRVRRGAKHCRVVPLSSFREKVKSRKDSTTIISQIIKAVLRESRIKKVLVPEDFPLSLARALSDLDIKLKVREGEFFAGRAIKSADEIKKISASLMMAEVGLAEGIHALKNSRISKSGQLIYRNLVLTAEKLRSIIDTAVLQAGGSACRTIVAQGLQACDPHERGHGPLKANLPIVLDVFPRSQKTGYYGDITRTVVRGRASESLRQVYHAVERAQEVAFKQIREGQPCSLIDAAVREFFQGLGFKTGKAQGRMQGFFHSTGHGLGLDLHEAPSLSVTSSEVLECGHVVTVEPGLYYSRIGGVRLEDVVLVTRSAARNLTKFEKVLEV